ncbi:PRC-barrel domain-containing protein [uncultured Sulfitobacter sp.]|uniref:PRC-barrel domain-containing protein n=1 Tax=uncultured Sulfitobacter sp. TaxID=191468 RepID=UPI002609D819|nr:PRC-barrel domain-containing protein [uncultured Sulfitobacter sp.]
MKNLLATTATAIILSTAAYADGHTAAFSDMTFDAAQNLNASDVIGMRVYASEASIEGTFAAGDEKNWDDIGEINEIVLTRDGDVQSVIVGVGGFVGIGEKDVAINMDQLQFVSEEGETDDFFLVVKASAVGVKEAPEYKSNTTNAAMETDTAMTAAPMMKRDGYENVTNEDFNSEDLTGARVYSATDEDIGEISELIMNTEGKIDAAIIDVGGFLGLGEKPVSVSMDKLDILRSTDDKMLRVHINATQEELEAQPEYEG